MKTMIITLITCMLAVQPNAFGHTAGLVNVIGDEAYIDDIPFNTESIAAAYFESLKHLDTGKLTEEKYVDDIPMNTSSVAFNCVLESLMQDDKTSLDPATLKLMPALISDMITKDAAEISLKYFGTDARYDIQENDVEAVKLSLRSTTTQGKQVFSAGVTN